MLLFMFPMALFCTTNIQTLIRDSFHLYVLTSYLLNYYIFSLSLDLFYNLYSVFFSVSPPKNLFVEGSLAPSAAPAAKDQGMSIPVIGSSEFPSDYDTDMEK